MNILMAINDKYSRPAKVMLTSLCLNNTFEAHHVYLLHSSLSQKVIDDLAESLSVYNCEVIPVFVDNRLFENLPVSHHFSIETYYRFLMQTMVPENVDRILWLDADMVVKGSLHEFYYQDLEDCCIAVCKSINTDPGSLLKKLCLPPDTVYFNAGIILFDLKRIRQEIDPKAYFEYAYNNPEKITWLDQDILNVIFADKKRVWDYKKYNYQHFSDTKFSPEDKKLIDNDVVVIHYLGAVKPWNFRYMGYPLKYYRKYSVISEKMSERIRFDLLHFAYAIRKVFKK